MKENRMDQSPDQFFSTKNSEKKWKSFYSFAGIPTLITSTGILLDVVIGNITGDNLTFLPQTAAGRFAHFQENKLLGLYNLDLLNIILQVIPIPTYIALYAVHRRSYKGYGLLALSLYP